MNNVEKNKGKDENGLSRDAPKKTSKNKKANWNDLKLTSEQRVELKQMTEQYNSRLQLVRNNISLNASEKQNQIRQVQREYNMQLGSVLTAEQKAKWEEKQRQSRLMMSQRELRNNKQGLNGSNR
ncbi:hypothetical protein [Niabella ginsengisoli]|uniref:DUF4890 domain-containing protein n=1 Tax=Niabella ginsengisoli TaxID=522298 RepID=A0ABS9SEH8_9BACT|nr:hypothetical protein [Niabella ginsengisoli]MCH5596772.1 hypothetical protein [Niabella ginsengisoli]